jgi:hypothetical protein
VGSVAADTNGSVVVLHNFATIRKRLSRRSWKTK